jgi:hypothetical protein
MKNGRDFVWPGLSEQRYDTHIICTPRPPTANDYLLCYPYAYPLALRRLSAVQLPRVRREFFSFLVRQSEDANLI